MISHFSILRIAKPFLLFLRCAFWFCVLVQVLVFLLRSFASVKFGCSCFLLRDFSFQSFVSAQLTAFLKLVSFFCIKLLPPEPSQSKWIVGYVKIAIKAMAIYSGFTHYSKYGDFPSIDVLFPLVGWLIEACVYPFNIFNNRFLWW